MTSKCHQWWKIMTIMFALLSISNSHTSVAYYGSYGGLGLSCQPNELIMVESELLGYSAGSRCNPKAMCSMPYTLAKWYCRGKSACWGMQVERRPLRVHTCGSMFTNCLQVKYRCVPGKYHVTRVHIMNGVKPMIDQRLDPEC